MKVFTSNDFKGVHPVGTAAVIIAVDEEDARKQLDAALAAANLPQNGGYAYTLHQIKVSKPCVTILNDGVY